MPRAHTAGFCRRALDALGRTIQLATPDEAADQERHGGKLEWRNRAGGRGEQGQQGPEQNGDEADGGGARVVIRPA